MSDKTISEERISTLLHLFIEDNFIMATDPTAKTNRTVDEQKVKAVEAETPAFHRSRAHMPRKVLQFVVIALKRSDGSILWKQTVCEEPLHSATHADGNWASASPASRNSISRESTETRRSIAGRFGAGTFCSVMHDLQATPGHVPSGPMPRTRSSA